MTTDDNLEALILVGQMLRQIHDLSDVLTAVTVASVLGGLAEFERELVRAGTGEGRKRAKNGGPTCLQTRLLASASKRSIGSPTKNARPSSSRAASGLCLRATT
jgi:DNA invertase Pin-like site-specific DNA recombinase